MDTINIQYLLWSVNTRNIGQVTLRLARIRDCCKTIEVLKSGLPGEIVKYSFLHT